MKLLCLLGSPRTDGNSSAIANIFMKTAESLGAELTRFELNRLNFRGCQGCCICKTRSESCIQKDGLTPALAAIETADIILLTSPIYFGEVSGQVKCFIDRTFGFFVPDYISNPVRSRVKPGKKLVLITTQGAPEGAFADMGKGYLAALKATLALGETHLIRACGVGSGGIPKGVPEKYLVEAEALARQLCS